MTKTRAPWTRPSERKRSLPAGSLAWALLLAAAGAAALDGQAPAAAERPFEGRTDVVEVQVPVNVVGRDGEPIADLLAADFRLFDEGKRQEIVGFEKIDLGRLETVPGTGRPAGRTAIPAVARRNILLLFDFSFSTAPSIVRARQAAQEFVLNALDPNDLVAIATFSLEFGPRLLVTFTPDRAQLARAIDTLGLTRRPGAVTDPLRFLFEPPQSLAASQGDSTINDGSIRAQLESVALENLRVLSKQFERTELNYERSRITAWSRSLADMAKALNAVRGRKHVIYFSEGFDSELLLGRRPNAQGADFDQEMLDRASGQLWMIHGDDTHGNTFLQGDINQMLEEFRRADGVIQAVDIAGLTGNPERGSGSMRSKGSDGLFYLANETGGGLFEATNDLASQLEAVLRRTEVTYVLTFRPPKLDFDGSYHRLKVQVEGLRGSRVSHRAGYYEPRPFQELHPLEKSLLASDAIASAEPRREIDLDVLAAPFRATRDSAYVPVIVEMEGQSLLFEHQGDKLAVEIYAYVTDERGEVRDFFSQSVDLDLRSFRPKLTESGLKYYGQLELPEGDYLLRVLVRNSATGRTGVAAEEIGIPAYSAAETLLLPPFFMDEPANKWLLLRPRQNDGSDSVVYPFTINGEPFVPSAKPGLRAGQKSAFCLVTYNLGDGRPELEAWIEDADGRRESSAEVELVERTVTGISGLDKLLASFRPKRLPHGDYTLEVELTDPVSGDRRRESVPFALVQ